ncbi:ubiquinone/menaquinone biosynthesis C-methylase UbiE [Pseudosporangium ferrugineum]|uniref:Ubiquinone/menaquinone biosynthesis C-methylase UbiE n=2 Tax=Pseudosporangium ferrugineum TaxID=439699 RepID=A0A2T0RDB3_9ACTN|nr:ubiquinone/menaquinone biosynthesis C-methylase UbiE [Pseudosporangium ferrugineum]
MSLDRNQVEWLRTCELLTRWLPSPPATVIDVGGGPGRQARHLLDHGYDVTLYDLVPKHVDQAAARGVPALVGDARRLPVGDVTADVVLLLGPLYHLPDATDRASALTEAVRVLRPGGVAVVAALSRWGRVLVRAAAGHLGDPAWHEHTMATMRDGRVVGGDAWDDAAYLHDVRELETELQAAGLRQVQVVGVEGPVGAWARRDPALNGDALEIARVAETAMAEASIHLLACGTKT